MLPNLKGMIQLRRYIDRITVSILLLIAIQPPVSAQQFQPVDAGSTVKFSIKNFGISTTGTLNGLKGTIIFQPDNLAIAKFRVSVNSSSIDTDNKTRDRHLRGEDYFNAEKFPLIIIESTSIEKASNVDGYILKGKLTIKGITRNINFPFTAKQIGNGYLFNGNFNINRLDFGVGSSSAFLANQLKVQLSIKAVAQ